MKQLEWFGLYANGWGKGDIVPDAFAHPAKFSKQLIRRIYDHLLTEGYIKPGDVVADCFAGVALGAFWAMRNGLHWRGVELEEKFVGLGQANIDLWNGRYAAHFPGWGTAQLLQGDSRRLAEVLGGAGCVVSSPPYAANGMHDNPSSKDDKYFSGRTLSHGLTSYGRTPGQLGSMPEGTAPAAIVSSPPYSDAISGSGEGPGARFDPVYHNGANATKNSSANGYGLTEGNLGNLAAVVSSPPFADSLGTKDESFWAEHNRQQRNWNGATTAIQEYGSTPGNIGNDTAETFWTAARLIVTQCYQILAPGGVAVWVTGDYVRDGKRVEFGKQWLALCEAVGFVGLEHITAWKTEPGPVQAGIFGNKDLTVDRVSFFRRLANNKAIENGNEEAVILSEDVWIVQKPVNRQ